MAGTVPGTAARIGRGRGDREPSCRQVSDATDQASEPGGLTAWSRFTLPLLAAGEALEQDRKLLVLTADEC